MTGLRIYAATSGECLVRDTTEVDEEERTRIERDFYTGVLLVIDAGNREVRGFVPAQRRADEVFFAVVDVDPRHTEDPLAVFRERVMAEFDVRPNWSIRYRAPEGALLQKPTLNHSPPDIISDVEAGPKATRVVDELETAVALLTQVPQENNEQTLAVARHNSDDLDYDLVLLYQPRHEASDEHRTDDASSGILQQIKRRILRRIFALER